MSQNKHGIDLGDPVVIDGTKYRIREIPLMHTFNVSLSPARTARFVLRATGELEWDRIAGLWRVPSGSTIEALT